ncbi:MAG: methyltransferase domain-containing protein [Acidothermus sp.]|nr:methyltransferase domain-containing protein [Acidothermus sp.]
MAAHPPSARRVVVPAEAWTRGDAYERYVGRWSRLIADQFVPALQIPPARLWLDVGCGTGALSSAVIAASAPRGLVGVDFSEAYLAFARDHIPKAAASFVVADAHELPFRDGAFDVVVSGLCLNFLASPQRALAEFVRVATPGATIAVYVWDYAAGMQPIRIFWDAATTLDPTARSLDEAIRFPLATPSALRRLFTEVGCFAVEIWEISAPARFRDFDDYWRPFEEGQGPAPGYVARLAESDRALLRETLRARLEVGADGAIDLVAGAWAVRARTPVGSAPSQRCAER